MDFWGIVLLEENLAHGTALWWFLVVLPTCNILSGPKETKIKLFY
jgi:hypothetical protein